MTSRQLFSVLISLVMFGHGVSPVKLMCIFAVFAIMSSKQLSKAMPHVVKGCKACKARTGLTSENFTAKSSERQKTAVLSGQDAKRSRKFVQRASQIWDADDTKKDA